VQIEKSRHRNGLARGENFRRNNGRNRIRGVVKPVAVFKNDRREDDDEEKQHVDLARRARKLSMLQNDLKNDVAGIAATVDHLFEQFVKIAQEDDVFWVVIALVKIAQQFQLELVG